MLSFFEIVDALSEELDLKLKTVVSVCENLLSHSLVHDWTCRVQLLSASFV